MNDRPITCFTIDRVKNGVMVRESYDPRRDQCSAICDTLVFNKREDFDKWMNDFFPKTKGEK